MAKVGTGLPRNTAGALAYLLGAITGVLFLVMEKDVYVQFHAKQSIGLTIVWIAGWVVLTVIPVVGWILLPFWGLGMFVLWLVAIVKAWQGEKFYLPLIGEYTEKFLKKV